MMRETTTFLWGRRQADLTRLIPFFFKNTCFYFLFSLATTVSGQCWSVTRNAGAISDIGNGPGVLAWTNPPNATFSDDSRATVSASVSANTVCGTHYLYARNFNMNIPSSYNICGFRVKIEHRKTGPKNGCTVKDLNVELASGQSVSANYAKATYWSDIDEVYFYGSVSDLWGMSWSPNMVNDNSFGVNITARLCGGTTGTSMLAEIDHVSVEVFFLDPLPIELLDFQAAANKRGEVDLAWSTATETNNDHFVVERSSNARDFEDIAWVAGAGNSQQTITYAAVDRKPRRGISYYRLRQVDENGTHTYSMVREVELKERNISILNEPGGLLVSITEGVQGLELINLQGELVWSMKLSGEGDAGAYIRINTEGMDPGIYFVRAVLGETEITGKALVMRD